jgi:tetratricopeptide (TPR) repeat protein
MGFSQKVTAAPRFRRLSLISVCSWSLVACTGLHKDKILAPQISALDHIVRPIGMTKRLIDSKTSMDAVESANAAYYFLLGQELSDQGHDKEAIAAYERVRQLDPEASHVHYLLAQSYLKIGRMKEGVAMARKALEIEPENRDAKLLLANLYATAKKYDEAFPLFEELQRQDPDDEEVMLYMALMEIEQKRLSEAYSRITKFLVRNPDSALANFYLGRLEQERGNLKAALKSYKKSVDIRPGFVQAGTYLAFLQEETGDMAGAEQSYSWLATQTDDATFHKKLGHIYLDENRYEEALKSFENFERVDPSDLNNKVKIGLILMELKKPREAAQKFESILKRSPESENVRFYLGAAYEALDRDQEAFEQYQKIQPSSKLYLEAWKRRVFNLAKQKKSEQGEKLIESAMANAEKENLPLEDIFETGVSFWDSLDQRARATAMCDEALAKFKGKDGERFLYLKGSLFEKDGKIDEAVALMQKILSKNPDHAGALNFVGYIWAERGEHLAQAERMIRRALKLRPEDPFITDSLAWVYYQRGNLKRALELLMTAVKARPDEPVIADHLGDVLVKLGRFGEAKQYYEQALKLGPSKDADKKSLESKLSELKTRLDPSCKTASLGSRGAACLERVRNTRSPASPGR